MKTMRKMLWTALVVAGAGTLAGSEAKMETPYGTASHLFGWEWEVAPQEFPMMQKEGIQMLRNPIWWTDVQSPDGVWVWDRLDKFFVMAKENDVKIVQLISMVAPRQYRPIPDHVEPFLGFVRTLAERHRENAHGYEVFNETNLDGMSAKDYARVLKAVAGVLREVAPGVPVCYGGTSGIAMDYIEESFAEGAADVVDAVSVHPYRWNEIPEVRLPGQLVALRELMKKYNAGDKPIWFTEVGYSSWPATDFGPKVFPLLLGEMGLKPETTRALVFYDPEWNYYTESHTFPLREWIPGLKEVREITMEDLKTLKPEKDDLVILPDVQSYPGKYVDALVEYVKNGGKVFSPAGFPFYFDLLGAGADGVVRSRQVDALYAPRFHIGWEAVWLKKGVPSRNEAWKWAPGFGEGRELPKFHTTYYFFNGDNLAEGDRFVPVIYGTTPEYKGVSAGVYHFDSDLKGKFAVGGLSWRGCTETDQARLLGRLFLISFGHGVEKIFWHNYRSTEHVPAEIESEFGLHRRNLERKPVSYAYEALTRELPDGSTRPVLAKKADCYLATWVRPDGEKAAAVWRASGKTLPETLKLSGKCTAKDYLGAPAEVTADGEKLTLPVGPGVTYLRYDGELGW